MSAVLKIKFLWIGLFLAFPPMAALALRESHESPTASPAVEVGNIDAVPPLKVPVEVLAKGEKAEWLMVEVKNEAIPEPGTFTLLMTLSSLLLLRRQREE